MPEDIIAALQTQKNVVLQKTGRGGGVNMFYRFFVFDDADVDTMVVRDADSRVHARDRWCIGRWLESGRLAHFTRDNICHNTPILGGLWGIRKADSFASGGLKDIIVKAVPAVMNDDYEFKYEDDQIALSKYIYPLLISSAVVFTDIPSRVYKDEYSEKIKEPLQGHNFCGQVVDFNEQGQEFISTPYMTQ